MYKFTIGRNKQLTFGHFFAKPGSSNPAIKKTLPWFFHPTEIGGGDGVNSIK